MCSLQWYFAHKKQPPPGTLHRTLHSRDFFQGPMMALGGGAVSYERGTPVRQHDEIY